MTRRLVLWLALCVPAVLNAQGVRVSGIVVRPSGRHSIPVTGALVVLHRFSTPDAGPVDSAPTDPAGAYRFVRPSGDSVGGLAVTVRHHGVVYVSEAAVFRGAAGQIALLTVRDTSSGVPVALAQRHVLVRDADRDGSRAVLELLVLRNSGDLTRVASAGAPVWSTRLAAGAADVVVSPAEGDNGSSATRVHGDTVAFESPLPPGDRQIVVSYVLPAARRLVLPLDEATGELSVMLADTGAVVAHGSVEPQGVMTFENVRYLRLEGANVAGGDSLVVHFPRGPVQPADLWWVVVGLSALALAAAAWRWRRADRARRGFSEAEILAARVAVMDRAGNTTERERAMAELVRTLANREGDS